MAAPPAPNGNTFSDRKLFMGARLLTAIMMLFFALGYMIQGDMGGVYVSLMMGGLVLFGPMILFRV